MAGSLVVGWRSRRIERGAGVCGSVDACRIEQLCARACGGSGGSPMTCSPCGISVYSSSSTAARSARSISRPPSASSQAGSASARSASAACAWISVASAARCSVSASGLELAPAVERGLEVEQAAIEAGVGDRRRQVADQRRGRAALGDRALGRVVGRVQVEVRQVADQPVRPAGRPTCRPACRA